MATWEDFQHAPESQPQDPWAQFQADPQAAAEQPGYGQSLLSAAGRGFASVVPGVVGGVGYLTGSEGLVQTAEDIEQSIAEALPINPAFEDDFAMKAASTVGQVGSILATGGAAGVAGKALQGVRLAGQAAQAIPYATGVLQGIRGGGQEAEQYGMEGAAAYGRALAGGAIEGLVERLPFGMLTETAAARRLLGEAVTPAGSAVREIASGIGTEATEEGLAQIGGNVATMGLAPEGVETPGLLEGVGEAAALGAVGGAAFGGVNALVRGRPQTIESGEAEIPESLRVAAEAGAFPNVDELENLAGAAATEEVAAAVRQAAELSPTPTYEQGLAPSQPEAGVAPVGIEAAAPLENLPVSEPIVPESRELPVVPVEPAAPAPEASVELEAAVTPTELETLVPAAEPVSAVETPVAPAPLEEALPPIAAEVTQPQPEPTEPNAPEIRQIIEDGQLQYQDPDEGGQAASEGQEVTETEEQRFQRIKAAPALARTQEDVDWANAYSRRRSPPPTPVEAPTVRAGFLERMTPMQRAKAEAALKTNRVRRNQLQSRREIVEEMVSSGATIQPHPKDKRRLMLPDGWFIKESRLTKTGMDYAEFLLSQAPAVVEAERVAEIQQITPTGVVPTESLPAGQPTPGGVGTVAAPTVNRPQTDTTTPAEPPLPPASMRAEQMARKRRGKAGVPQSVRDQDGAAVDVRVTPAEAQRAREIEGKQIPGVSEAWVGTTDEFLAEFGDLPDFDKSTTAVRADGGLEAFYDPKMDRAFILIDRAQAREGDARRAVRYGTSTGIETVRRLLRHEAFAHRGWRALPTNLKTEFINLLPNLITPDDIDSLVAKGYARYANWREDPLIYYMAAEEWLATRIERISKLPRAQQGKWTDFMDWLKRVFQWLTGDDTVEPTPKELTDIMRQMVRALEVREAEVRAPEVAGIRPSLTDADAAYLAAVERGDMDDAQRLAGAAARAKGLKPGVRSGFYDKGVPLLPSTSSNLGAAYYAALDTTVEEISQFANTPRWNGLDKSIDRITGNVFIDLGDKPLVFSHPTDVSQFIKDQKLEPVFEAWLDLQETITSAYQKVGASRPDSLETRRAGDLRRVSQEEIKEKRRVLKEAGWGEKDLEALGFVEGKTIIEVGDAGKGFSFLFDRGYATSVIVDWGASGKSVSGDSRMIKEVAVANPSQIKSADPVTYDNNGNVIPLSQRFQSESSDIRFSLNDREQRLSEIANSGSGQYQESDALPFTAEAVPGRPVREVEGQTDIARNLNYETAEIAKVREAAMKFVDDLGPMETWFDQLGNPDWQQKVGLRPGSPLGQFVLNEALVRTQAEALVNPAVYTVNRQLADYINATGSVLGGALGTRAAIQRDPRYIAMYATQSALDLTRKQQKTVIDPQVNVPQAVEAVQVADQRAREQATTETAEELDLDQIVLDLGMAALDPTLREDIREINNHVLRIGTLQRLRQRLTSGVSQSLANLSAADLEAQYAGLTVEQIDTLLAQEQEALAARVAKVKGAMAGKPKQRVAAADSPVEQARKLIDRLEAAPTTRKPKANPVRDLYKKHLTEPMAEVDFIRELGALGVPAAEASRLYAIAQVKLAAVEVVKQGRQERGVRRRLADLMDPSKGSLLNALNRLRGKVTGDVNWSKIFEAPFERQQQWRVELYRALRADPALANLTPQEARDLAAEVDRIWNLKRQKAFDDQMKRVNLPGVKPEAKKKVQESAPQLLRYINVGTFGDDSFRQAVSKKFGIKALSADEIKRISDLAQAAQADGISTPERSRILDELVKTLQSSRNAEIGEILSNYWVTSVLSGFRTQFDTALAFFNGLRVMSQGVAYSAITKRDFKLAGRAAKDYFKTLADTLSEAVAYFVTGDPTLLDGYQYGLQTFFKEGVAASAPYDYFEQVIKSKDARALAKFSAYFMAGVQRAMRAFDHINSVSTTEGWKSLAVTLDQNRYRDARLPTPGDVEAARKKAVEIVGSDKGFTNRAKVSAATRQILNDTLNQEFPGLLDEAREIGLISSYQNDPTGIGGIIYHTLLGVTNKAVQAAGKFRDQGTEQRAASEWSEARKLTDKALRGILYGLAVNSRNITGTRFVRFAGNRFNELLSFLPGAGLLRLYEKDMTESKRAMLITNNIVGGMLGLAVFTTLLRMLSDEEDDEKRGFRVEGSWSNLTPDQKNQLRSQGRSPYTLSFYDGDGKWSNFNYNSWPVAGILAAAGTLNDLRQYAPEKWEAKDMLDRVVSAAWAGVTTFKDLSALSGLMDLLGTSAYASGDPVESAKKWAAKFAANFGGGFIPRAVKDIDAMMDPEIRKPDDMAAYFAKEVPFFRRLEVGGQKLFNIFGEPVQINRQPWSRSYTQAELDDEYRTLGELNSRGLFLGAANPTNRTIGSGPTRRELTDREAELYMQTAGKFYKDYIRSQGERLLRLPNEQAKKAISQDTERLRNAALRRAVSEAKKEGT